MKPMKAAVLFVVALLAMNACSGTKPDPAKAANPTPSPLPAAAPKPDDTFVTSGPLVVENQVDVAAQREGVVAEILVDVGAAVRKGQLLAKLDDRQLSADTDMARARIAQIQANVENWEAEVKVLEADRERAEKMSEAQLITKQDLDHVRFKLIAGEFELERERHALKSVQAQARSIDLELAKTHVGAPFGGVVARRYVRVGQKVAVGDRLFWVTAVAPVRVRFTLPEKFVGKVHPGAVVTVTTANAPEEEHSATVIFVSPVVDPSSGTIEVLAELTGPPGDLRPGMTAQVRVAQRP